jgi:hypothetical protein
MQKAVFDTPYEGSPLERVRLKVRAAKMAAWPMNETLDAEQQPRLLTWVNNEAHKADLKLRGYKPLSYEVYVQFVSLLENAVIYPCGSPLRIASSTTKGDLCVKLTEKLEEDHSKKSWYHYPPPQLHTFSIDEREVTGTLGEVVSWEQAIDDETPIPIVYKRDYAFARFVEGKWPEWERLGAPPVNEPIEDVGPSAASAAATRAELAAKLNELKSVEAPAKHLKEARCLHAGMLALLRRGAEHPTFVLAPPDSPSRADMPPCSIQSANSDGFEFDSTMLRPDDVSKSYATQLLNFVIDDLKRRKDNGANAPAICQPADKESSRHHNDIVLCSTPEHRIVLADCLLDAFWAFNTETAEAKAARAAFKPAVPRPNRQKGNSSATDA